MSGSLERSAIVVFAREPKDGKVKTRLLKDIPAPTVTRLYKSFIRKVLNMAALAKSSEKYIYFTGGLRPLAFLGQFEKKFSLKRQTGKTLGDRMHQVLLNHKKKNISKTIIIGTDCLSIRPQDISRAFRLLSVNDLVLGPSRDGGYYLIGLNQPNKKLFQGISWSTDTVLKDTLKKAREAGMKIALLDTKEDIDDIASLKRHYKRVTGKDFKI